MQTIRRIVIAFSIAVLSSGLIYEANAGGEKALIEGGKGLIYLFQETARLMEGASNTARSRRLLGDGDRATERLGAFGSLTKPEPPAIQEVLVFDRDNVVVVERENLVVVKREDLRKALAQVGRYEGAQRLDQMSIDELSAYLRDDWPAIRAQLLEGSYTAQAVVVRLPIEDR